jgi:hypothetical protein
MTDIFCLILGGVIGSSISFIAVGIGMSLAKGEVIYKKCPECEYVNNHRS